MHQVGCRDAVLHYNYELGLQYMRGRNPSKERKRGALAPPHLQLEEKAGSPVFSGGKPG